MKLLRQVFQILTFLIIFAVASAWLQDNGYSWTNIGKYVLRQFTTLASKVGEDILQMDWTFRR